MKTERQKEHKERKPTKGQTERTQDVKTDSTAHSKKGRKSERTTCRKTYSYK